MSAKVSEQLFVPVLPNERGRITAHRNPTLVAPDAEAITKTLVERSWEKHPEHYVNFIQRGSDESQIRTAFRVDATETRRRIGSSRHTQVLDRATAQLERLAENAPVVTVFISTPIRKAQAA